MIERSRTFHAYAIAFSLLAWSWALWDRTAWIRNSEEGVMCIMNLSMVWESGFTSRSSVETWLVLRPSLKQSALFHCFCLTLSSLFLSLSFSLSLSRFQFSFLLFLSSFWTLLFTHARLSSSNSTAAYSVNHVFCKRRRGDVFKFLSRQESSAFVGKPMETILPSVFCPSFSLIRDITSALTNGGDWPPGSLRDAPATLSTWRLAMKLYGDSSPPKIGRPASALRCQWD